MSKKIEDAGEKIAGARKYTHSNPLSLRDVDNMARSDLVENINKANVWPKPDYAEWITQGMEPKIAALIHVIRNKFAAKPSFSLYQLGTREIRDPDKIANDYVSMLGNIRDALSNTNNIKTESDVSAALNGVIDDIGWNKNKGWKDDETRHLLFSVYRGTRSPLIVQNKDISKANKLANEGFPNTQPAKKSNTVKRKQDTIEKPSRPHLESIVRTLTQNYRNGSNVPGSEAFIDSFGFRGVQFGLWLPDDERQEVLNKAYDALMDLALVLDFDPKDISLGGNLALSFGARGRGKALAHYEPGQKVLNLTRLKGAGSLAHEFAHALDHWSGCPEGEDKAPVHPGGVPSGTGWHHYNPKKRAEYLSNLSSEQSDAWGNLVINLYQNEATSKYTDYAREASKIGASGSTKGNYWLRPTEMFARAFECYVFDRIKEMGGDSPYLVHGVEEDRFAEGYKGNPYPSKEERVVISSSIDDMISKMRPTLKLAYEDNNQKNNTSALSM